MLTDGVIVNNYRVSDILMDIDYRLKPVSALGLIEDAVCAFTTEFGIAAFDIQQKGISWVISDIMMEFQKDCAHWSDEIQVRLWIGEMSPLRTYFNFEMLKKSATDNEPVVCMRGYICYSVIEMESGKPVRCDNLAPDMPVNGTKVFGKHPKVIIQPSEKPIGSIDHRIVSTDIDFNCHVNNLSYMTTALSFHDYNFLRAHYPSIAKLKFLKQTFSGDTLTCDAFAGDGNIVSYFLRNSAGEEVCRIEIDWAENEIEPFKIVEYLKRDS